jgi:LPXTG-motif cell wall-anchored protein
MESTFTRTVAIGQVFSAIGSVVLLVLFIYFMYFRRRKK